MRHGDADVVVRGVHVELGLEQVGVGDPPVHVVVDGDLRIPVAHQVDPTFMSFPAVGRGRRWSVGPGHVEPQTVAWRERLRQGHPHHRAIHGVLPRPEGPVGRCAGSEGHRVAVHSDVTERDAACDRHGIAAQKAKGLYREIDESIPVEERAQRLKEKIKQRQAEKNGDHAPR